MQCRFIVYFEDKVLAVGGGAFKSSLEGKIHNHVEYYSSTTNRWSTGLDYPYHDEISTSAIISDNNDFLVFGGTVNILDKHLSESTSIIAKYNVPLNKWSKLGELNGDRASFGVIGLGDEYLVVGGTSYRKVESCRLENDKMICSETQLALKWFW